MIPFDLSDPFPLLAPQTHTYKDAQEHSAQVDHHLGFYFQTIEENLIADNPYRKSDEAVQTWQGLPVQAMQTPYTEIRYMLSLLNPKPGQTVIDLGCAYGRMAFVMGRHYPDVNFIGYELVQERVLEAQRILSHFSYPRVRVETKDLSSADFTPPLADYYFIFDFGSPAAIEKNLNDLRVLAQTKPITVIARGRGIRHQIYQSHPWLAAINTPEVYDHFTFFRS
ncbi:SAM-dependent methyltransferase [Bdellovibrio sp. HCB337]|uniref:SAM-dependent methyltransferase n=1 Tax=Bdellovibrio sp. HCB337 TaxID=3394358 RepID=UPI0039A685EE